MFARRADGIAEINGKSLAEGNWEQRTGRRLRVLSGDVAVPRNSKQGNSTHERQRDTQTACQSERTRQNARLNQDTA